MNKQRSTGKLIVTPSLDQATLSAQGRLRRWAWLSGMGCTVLAGGLVAPPAAAAPNFGSPAWFAQQGASRAAPGAAQNPGNIGAGNLPGTVVNQQQAQVRSQRSVNNLMTAVAQINQQQAAQLAARQLAIAGPNQLGADPNHPGQNLPEVRDGLSANGLVPDSGLQGAGQAHAVTTWVDAATPTQVVTGDQTTVTVKQEKAKAILNWAQFDVGKNTTLHIDQSGGTQVDGNNNWVALNRVLDSSGRPSQILGAIKAEGDVYVINRNGILFGGSSQINTHSFLASSLALFSSDLAAGNAAFLNSGVASALGISDGGIFARASLLLGEFADGKAVNGDIRIDAGARIDTGKLGYSLIAAPNVRNAGTITATDGQVIVAAAGGVGLRAPDSSSGQLNPYIANENDPGDGIYRLENTGVIQASRGNVSLLGTLITQNGVVGATTSVSRPGSIVIDAEYVRAFSFAYKGVLRFGSGSLTTILPSSDGETTSSSLAASEAFIPGRAAFTAGSITLDSGALIEAPGADLSFTAVAALPFAGRAENVQIPGDTSIAGRVYIDKNATVDVAGIANIQKSVQDTLVAIRPVTNNDLADSPLLRSGFLFTRTVVVDSTLSGTRADGLQWQGSPVISASGYIQNIPRTVSELLVDGGSLKVSAVELITRSGSFLNLDGGYLNYQGGTVSGTTRLIAANGRQYDIGSADPNLLYVGIAGQFIDANPRFNAMRVYDDKLLSGALARYQPGFIQGGNAGTLSIDAGVTVLDGALSAQAYVGRNQARSGSQPQGGRFALGTGTAQFLGVQFPASVVVTDRNVGLAESFDAITALATPSSDPTDPDNLLAWTPINGTALAEAGFSALDIRSVQEGTIPGGGQIIVGAGAQLTVTPGGSIRLDAGRIRIDGSLSARSGSIEVSTTQATDGPSFGASADGRPAASDVIVGNSAVLDASGLFVNDGGRAPEQISGSRYIDGGRISLATPQMAFTLDDGITIVDVSGSLLLKAGSLLDVSSGAYVQPDGQLLVRNGVPAGDGGAISLINYSSATGFFGDSGTGAPTTIADRGVLELGATLRGYGFANGGSLSLRARGFQIGGEAALSATVSNVLAADFFSGGGVAQGFGSYSVNSEYDTVIADGSTVRVSHQNLLPNYQRLLQAASGSALLAPDSGLVSIGALAAFQRRPTELSLTAGDYIRWNQIFLTGNVPVYDGAVANNGSVVIGSGAAVIADAGAALAFRSLNRVSVLGKVSSPGGSITLAGGGGLIIGQPVSIWLGPDAALNTAGVALIDPTVAPVNVDGVFRTPRTGTVLDGGTVRLAGGLGQVVVQRGALIDVSGASDRFDLPEDRGAAQVAASYRPQAVWSDGGSIRLEAGTGLYFEGSLRAGGGQGSVDGLASHGQDGSLSLVANTNDGNSGPGAVKLDNAAVILQASGAPRLLPDDWTLNAAVPGAALNTLYFSLDRLQDAGIGSLSVTSNGNLGLPLDVLNGSSTQFPVLGRLAIGFAGDVALTLDRAISLDAARFVALADGSLALPTLAAGYSEPGNTVSLAAPYVSLSGYNSTSSETAAVPTSAARGNAVLEVNARFIDFGGAFALNGFADARFTSSGAIRFVTPSRYLTVASASNPQRGALYTPGNLEFAAAALYPATANSFAVVANAQGAVDADGQPVSTSISIRQNGRLQQPLSAGGRLLLDADVITQAGTVLAPAGTIVLGVGQVDDAALAALFNPVSSTINTAGQVMTRLLNPLPLVATRAVTLADGSLTSVSLDGQVVPYGTTLDDKQWQYNPPDLNGFAVIGADLVAPPPPQVQVNGAAVALAAGATVNLSGGGDLQAIEFVPGIGGSRDVLSRSFTTYTNTNTGEQVPLYPDLRGIYALVPSYLAPVAAYDAIYLQNQADIPLGQSVQLSAGRGIAAGTYTLMPAKYATLPGALRIVQDTSVRDATPRQNALLPDGTVVVSGRYADALSGATDARSSQFQVQTRDVWGLSSEYHIARANSFFAALATEAGKAIPRLPQDAGQLILGASGTLALGASLNTAPATGGAAARIDIASQNIQIIGGSGVALDGYLQIAAGDLAALSAGSLLVGGTRASSASGTTITALATSVVLSNDADSALSGPEILLVTRTDPNGTDANAGNGLRIDSGSVLRASGSLPTGSGSQPITIGRAADASGLNGVNSDGALLMVSNGQPVSVLRPNLPAAGGSGLLEIRAGARLDGGNALLMNSAGDTVVDPTAILAGTNIAADSRSITFIIGDAASGIGGLVIGTGTLAQFANAERVSLRSYGGIDFEGDVSVAVDNALLLSGGSFTAGAYGNAGQTVSLGAGQLTLSNELNAASSPAGLPGTAALQLNGQQIDFGSSLATGDGAVGFGGFGSVTATAAATGADRAGIVGANGRFDFGALDVSLNAPVILAAANSDTTLITTGNLNLATTPGTALIGGIEALGGELSLIGGNLRSTAQLAAAAGNLRLQATRGDLLIASGATVSVAGIGKNFFDVVQYAPGGNIALAADAGNVRLESGATLDFSAAAGGGDAGSLSVSAAQGGAVLDGTLSGGGAKGLGGGFALDTGSAVDLGLLAQRLASSGIERSISVRAASGDLALAANAQLSARDVSLVADGGSVIIGGSILANGAAGGRIALYGAQGVALDGRLSAIGSDPKQRGGTVVIGTSGSPDGTLDSRYGYQRIDAASAGTIRLGSAASIDVSGGSAGGLSGGTVSLRAPLLANDDVEVEIVDGLRIAGARQVSLEAYAVWSTADAVGDPTRHFDGIIDPAGWFDAQGNRVAGNWIDQNGNPVSGTPDPASQFFTPTAANAAHQGFYGYLNGDAAQGAGTLMGYVQNFGEHAPLVSRAAAIQSRVTNFRLLPGIELQNPAAANVNGGDIRVLSNWNLGATDAGGQALYRYNGTAPVLTVRAANNLQIDASVSDGFSQQSAGPNLSYSPVAFNAATTSFGATSTLVGNTTGTGRTVALANGSYTFPAGDANYSGYMMPVSGQAAGYYAGYTGYTNATRTWSGNLNRLAGRYTVSPANLASGAPQLASFADYASYSSAYSSWLSSNFPASRRATLMVTPTPPQLPVSADSAQYSAYLAAWNGYYSTVNSNLNGGAFHSGTVFVYIFPPKAPQPGATLQATAAGGNAPANVGNTSNLAPLAYGTLSGGDSSSYRLVAGADFASADPLALVPLANFADGQGSLSLTGHTEVTDLISTFDNTTTPILNLLLFPTTVRTGSGGIDIASARDFALRDTRAPGTVYTAGLPLAGTVAESGIGYSNAAVIGQNASSRNRVALILSGPSNPDAAGDIRIRAQDNILGNQQVYDLDGRVSGTAGSYLGQFWTPWLQTGNRRASAGFVAPVIASSINFGAFGQGVLSAGGNVEVDAGGDIRELSVSLPTTWNLAVDASGAAVAGGGNLAVRAGGSIVSGTYFVAKGNGSIRAGGSIVPGFSISARDSTGQLTTSPLATLIGLQDATIAISARQSVDLAGVVNPSYLVGTGTLGVESQSYSSASAVTVLSTSGEVTLNSYSLGRIGMPIAATAELGGGGGANLANGAVLPATLELTALSGGIDVQGGGDLYPSPVGNLSLIAAGDIGLRYSGARVQDLRLSDSYFNLRTPLNPGGLGPFVVFGAQGPFNAHLPIPLHAEDAQPVRIYSLNGDVFGGFADAVGVVGRPLAIYAAKPALIYAGHDIVNLNFTGQNLANSDITRIVAGHDLYDSSPAPMVSLNLAGPGSFDIQAGRNIGPLFRQGQPQANGLIFADGRIPTGINTFGNDRLGSNVGYQQNPYLSPLGANVSVLFGVAPSLDAQFNLKTADFIARYLGTPGTSSPGVTAIDGVPDYSGGLVRFVENYQAGQVFNTGLVKDQRQVSLSPEQAWAAYQQLPGYVQQRYVTEVFANLLFITGQDYNVPTSPYFRQYARGYEAINTLFPPSLGYTQNNLDGGSNGANQTVRTGDLDLRGSTIQTQQGGNIEIYGPGGQALLSSASAPPQLIGPEPANEPVGLNTQGLLTLERGDITLFTDRSVLLAQSRIFTEQGGDLLIWTSNGDINAGNGRRSTSFIPPLQFACNPDQFCLVDAKGLVTGAGIATLQTTPEAAPGDVVLIAPRGTVDAGNAGIRVSGNLTVAALRVANVFNIEVQGTSVGVPQAARVDTGALTSSNAASNAATQAAALSARPSNRALAQIAVEVVGYGVPDEEQKKRLRKPR